MLAAVDFSSPLLWAICIGWILTVVLHEFAHGVVAHFGGDYTIKERGGLTLNPLQYIDPIWSIVVPVIFLLMGGVPLPGGATYIRTDLLRNRAWRVATSAAGPAMNLLIFFLLALALHPRLGWTDPHQPITAWSNAQLFCGAMMVLQLFAAMLNLLPVPPLDGFQMIAPFLKEELRLRLMTPPLSTVLFLGLFIFLMNSSLPAETLFRVTIGLLSGLGYDEVSIISVFRAFQYALWGEQ